MAITCPSVITHVNVHARGALVTRRLAVPSELPDGDVELAADGVTPLAEGGSVRASLPDGASRAVLAVRTGLVVPAAGAITGASIERVRDLEQRVRRARAEHDHLAELRAQLGSVTLDPGLRARSAGGGPRDVGARTADALAASSMVSSLEADLDARLVSLDESLRALGRELDGARLADAQASTAERLGAHPTRRVSVHLTGAGPVAHVDVVYAVPAARWWPVYTLRIRDNGRKASWLIEALVAQLTGEDWTHVRLSLSTADLLFDARLPELPSLRIGKAQVPPKRAYRAPPAGLDRMFEGYDRAFMASAPTAASATATLTDSYYDASVVQAEGAAGDMLFGATGRLEESDDGETRTPNDTRKSEAPRAPTRTRAGAAPPAPRAQAAAPSMAMPYAPQAARAKGAFLGGITDGIASLAPGGGGGYGAGVGGAVDERPIEPDDAWLDFDTLSIKSAGDRAHRGRLVREPDARTVGARSEARQRIESTASPPGGRDPMQTRGMFDHRYEADGAAEIPSDAQTHRVSLGQAETAPTMRWRTVPREAAEVYREAELRNPFDAPLLAGPVDVYVDGSLLAVASVERIDRGGTMHVGMGVEQRLRVARNVRVREETSGILGGDTIVHHDVSLELSSALNTPALVEVVDRLPVSDDKDVEVVLVRSAPERERYAQSDRGAAVRGGMRWSVIVPAGGKATVEYQYRLTLPSKNEIVGGNRRD